MEYKLEVSILGIAFCVFILFLCFLWSLDLVKTDHKYWNIGMKITDILLAIALLLLGGDAILAICHIIKIILI